MARPRTARPKTLAGDLGAVVEALRLAKGWRSTDLAEHSGVGAGTIGRIERGAVDTPITKVVMIAHALGMSAADLMTDVKGWQTKR